MRSPLVSIIIVNWNRKKDIIFTLNKVAQHNYKNLEVIIVDNGSSDDSAKEITENFSHHKLIKLSCNIGCEEGYNVGILNSDGEIIVFLDSDAYIEKGGISKIVDEFSKDKDLGIVDPLIFNYHTKEIQNQPKNWPPENTRFVGCAAACSRKLLNEIGLRPGNYFIYASEDDVCIRALDAGFKIRHVPSIRAFHKESPIKRLSPKFYYYNTRNVIWLICKYYPLLAMIRELVFHLVINFLKALKALKIWQYIKGVVTGFYCIPRVLKNDRKILKKWYLGRVYPSNKTFFKILLNKIKN